MPFLFLGLPALGVIRYYVWLDFSFELSGAKLENSIGLSQERRIFRQKDCRNEKSSYRCRNTYFCTNNIDSNESKCLILL